MLHSFQLNILQIFFSLLIDWRLSMLSLALVAALLVIIYLIIISNRNRQKLLQTKDMLRVQLEIQDLTFSAISREVHDNVGQILSLAKVQLHLFSEDTVQHGQLLEQAKENISNAMNDLREIAKSLSNKKLISLGLYSSIQHEVNRINDNTGWDVQLSVIGNPIPVTETQHLVIFRAVQYFLNRIVQLEEPKRILISIEFHPNNWQVCINHSSPEIISTEQNEQMLMDDHSLIVRRLSIIGATFTKLDSNPSQILITIPYA